DVGGVVSERLGGGGGAAAAGVLSRGGPRGPRPLPAVTTSLIGREEDIGEVTGLLELSGGRLVTLTGPGGVGKTRLALAVGERLGGALVARVGFVLLAGDDHPPRG